MAWKSTRDNRIKRRGTKYYARFSRKEVRVECSLNTSNFDIAVDLCNKIEAAIHNGEDWREIVDPKVRQIKAQQNMTPLICELYPNQFMKDKKSGARYGKVKIKKCRENTLNGYQIFYDLYYSKFWENKTILEITEENWAQYLDFAREKSARKEQTKMKNHWMYFSGFCTWLVAAKYLDKKPEIYNPDEDLDEEAESEEELTGVGRNLSDYEMWILREKSRGGAKLWIYMAQYMGMRSSEITQLKKIRINLDTGLITLLPKDTKTKQGRKIPIHPEVLPLLIAQIEKSGGSQYLFPNAVDKSRPMDKTGFGRQWDDLRQTPWTKEDNPEETFLIDCRFHDLRHSCATRLFADPKINPVLVCKMLGMSMAVAMKIYIHFDENHLKAVTHQFELKTEFKIGSTELGQIQKGGESETT